MSAWAAFLWAGFASASLYIGEALARPMERKHRLTGLVMGFGAGTLLSAIAYELIPESNLANGIDIGLSALVGALVYYVADRVLDEKGVGTRQEISSSEMTGPGSEMNGPGSGMKGSGAAIFLGTLLDGIPEAFILGTSLALGGSINVAFITAVFISNIPEGVAGTTNLRGAGYSDRRILRMWSALTITCALSGALGYQVAHMAHVQGLYSQAFAAGAMLTMLSDSMMPEAFEHGGKSVGLVVVLGYLIAAALSVAQ
jgi:zinc transporter, ZIP family